MTTAFMIDKGKGFFLFGSVSNIVAGMVYSTKLEKIHSTVPKYSRTSVARTLMARLPRLFRTRS